MPASAGSGVEALRVAREVLDKLGLTIPRPSRIAIHVLVRSLRSQALVRRKGVDFLRSLPPVSDPLMNRAYDLLHLLGEVATLTGSNDLHAFAAAEVVHLSLKQGAGIFFATQVIVNAGQCAVFDNHEMAARLHQISISLTSDKATPSRGTIEARIISNVFISHWTQPETTCLEAALKLKDFVMGSCLVDELFYVRAVLIADGTQPAW